MRELVACAAATAFLAAGCARAASLENTEWQLVRLDGANVVLEAGQREPHLVLRSETRRAAGFGGCNRFTGDYALDGESISLGPLASTRMACAHGMDLEQALHAALSRAARWRITGAKLELLDAAGNPVADFEARP